MGGAILHYPKIKWTIFSLSRGDDADRAPKFKKVCKFYGAKPIISNLEDEGIMSVKESIPAIKTRIIKLLKTKKFDYLFTHGLNGEYGHPRHLGVNRAVGELLKTKKIIAKKIFYFSYKGKNEGDGSHCKNDLKKARYNLNLTPDELKQKQKIIHEMYGFSEESFEYASCLKKEAFS